MKERKNWAITGNEVREYNYVHQELMRNLTRNNYSTESWVFLTEYTFINVVATTVNMHFNEDIRKVILRTDKVSRITYEYSIKGLYYFKVLIKVNI